MALLELVRIIVRQLFAWLNVPDRLDPDPIILDHGVAVGIAGVIDEPCVIPVHCGVDHDPIVDREQEGVMPRAVLRISRIRVSRR